MADLQLAFVVWQDTETDSGWEDISEGTKARPRICHSVGWLVHRDESCVILAQTIHEDQMNGRICIPAAWLKGEIVPVDTGGNVVDFKSPA